MTAAEREYLVHGLITITYKVWAESAELAGEYAEQGDAGEGEVQYLKIESVTLPDDHTGAGDDLRKPVPCKVCGKPQPASAEGRRCLACVLDGRR